MTDIGELDIEIGLKPDDDTFVFCRDADGFASLQAIVTIEFDSCGDWYVSAIDLETSEYKNRRMHRKRTPLKGKMFKDAKAFLEREEYRRLEDHVLSFCRDFADEIVSCG